MKKMTLNHCFALLCTIALTSCSTPHIFETPFASHPQSVSRDNIPLTFENPDFWQGNPETVWTRVQQTPLNKLNANQNNPDAIKAGWIKLAIISKRYSVDTTTLTQQLIAWRAQYPSHPGNEIFPGNSTLSSLATTPAPKNIALLLPLQGKYAALGNAVRNGFLNAYYEQSGKSAGQNISFIDTSSGASIGALYQQAIAKGADFVVGPLTKNEVQQLISSGGFSVPTLALNYTDVWLSLPNNLYEFGLSPLDEATQIADKAAQTGHSHAIIIAPQTEWGHRVVKSLSARWLADGGTITDTFYFSAKSDLTKDIAQLLHVDTSTDSSKNRDKRVETDRATLEKQRRHDFDVIFLLAPPQSARQIVPLLRFYYVDKTAIFSTSLVYAGFTQPQKDFDLNGVTFSDTPWVLSGKSSDSNPEANRLFAVGHDAYLISHNLSRFTLLPNFPVYGQTGALTLTPQKQFYRRLAWAQFHNGHP